MLIKNPQGWESQNAKSTPERTYMNRRQLLAGLDLLASAWVLKRIADAASVRQNTEYNVGDRPVTEEWAATGYNNFYEFNAEGQGSGQEPVGKFQTSPWSVQVSDWSTSRRRSISTN